MDMFTLSVLMFFSGLTLFVITLVLIVLSREGFKFLNARLFKRPLLLEFNPVTRTFRVKLSKSETLYEDKEEIHFLAGTPAYKYGGVPVFLVIKGSLPTVQPEVIAEVQKSLSANVLTYEQLEDVVKNALLEERVVEKVVETPEGPKKVAEKYVVLKPLMTTAHRVINYRIKPKKRKKEVEVTAEVEVYEPLKIETITTYFSRNLSSQSIKKILDFRDLVWAETTRKVYEKIKELKRGSGTSGFNPIWLVYLGIFIFIVFMALSLLRGHATSPGGVEAVRPPTP